MTWNVEQNFIIINVETRYITKNISQQYIQREKVNSTDKTYETKIRNKLKRLKKKTMIKVKHG